MAPAPEPPAPDFAGRFAALQRNFVAGLPKRLQEIEHAPDAPSLHAALHRLAGAAGSYGFAELGNLARAAQSDTQGSQDQAAALARLQAATRATVAAHATVLPQFQPAARL